jgi:hypothetical protein
MGNEHVDDRDRRTARAAAAAWMLSLAVSMSPEASAADPNAVPAQHRGSWVPAQATCESPVRVVVGADRLTLQNGSDKEALGGIEMAGPGYFAPGYRGIMAVLLTEFSGEQPAMVTFNPREKKGAAQVDFAPPIPGNGTAQSSAYNARISKLNLGKRFPIDKVLLKKCPGAAA